VTRVRRELLLWAGIAGCFAATRVPLVRRFPPHVDESLYATWTLYGYWHARDLFVALTRGQQPLLEWLGIGVMWLGAGPLVAVRLVSLLSGLATLGLVWYLGLRLGGRPTAYASAGLFAIVPYFVVYTVIGLEDPLATMLVTAAVVLAILLAERPRVAVALALGAALGCGLLTKLTTGLAYALIPLTALFFDWSRANRPRRLLTWLGYVALSLVVSWSMYQVLRFSQLYDDLAAARRAYFAPPANWPLFGFHLHRIVLAAYGRALFGYLTVPVIVAIVAGVARGIATRSRYVLFLSIWACVIPAVSYYPYVRWLDVGMPPLVVIAAYGVVGVVSAVRGRVGGGVAGIAAVAVLALAVALPAVAWDTRTVASPTTRPYPGPDDEDYVRGRSAGGPWLRLVPELRRLSRGRPMQVAFSGPEIEYVLLVFTHDPSISIVEADRAAGAAPLYGFENEGTLKTSNDGLAWRRIQVLQRPRAGVPVVLYQRVAVYRARTASTPARLRALVGRAGWKSYLATHPHVRRWTDAWHVVHGP
jgi:4-amino-4-deoxy-L-arabinose transferase-like glycosyltransferase